VSRVDFAASRKSAEREGLIKGGDFFKFKEGANRVRLMSECLPYRGEYNGVANFKWLCHILDRENGEVKVFFMPHTVYTQIEALQGQEDYAFDSVPMPYDITINAHGAGTKEVKYTVVPARKNSPLSASEESAFATKKTIQEVKAAMRAKEAERKPQVESNDDTHETFDPESVEAPF